MDLAERSPPPTATAAAAAQRIVVTKPYFASEGRVITPPARPPGRLTHQTASALHVATDRCCSLSLI